MIYETPPQISLQKFLCLDIGTKKTGVASNFANNRIAFPLETIATENVLQKILDIKRNNNFAFIIIGLPTAYTESESFNFITHFTNFLQENLPQINFIFWDESNSSDIIRKAYKIENRRKGFSKKFHDGYDMQSAALILGDFLLCEF